MNRVSDERLSQLVESTTKNAEAAKIFYLEAEYTTEGLEHAVGLASAVAELQSLRQASVAGVEDAAERIWIALLLKGRASESLLDELQDVEAEGVIAAELTAFLSERDAVLRECREIVQQRHDAWKVVETAFYEGQARADRDGEIRVCADLLARIDAILGKEGDGA